MSEPFVGEIKMFAGNFAPRGWALCDGQLVGVSQNDALFSLLGTIYGGDGRTTFGIPELRGRIPIHAGSGPGLSTRRLGAKLGAENVTLTVNQIPSHDHSVNILDAAGTEELPNGMVQATRDTVRPFRTGAPNQTLASDTIANAGGSNSHTNLMPTLCVNFIIALVGVYPSRH